MSMPDAVLVDTNAIIEAVRTHCWPAVTGHFRIETVQECQDETLRGDARDPSYIEVTGEDLARIAHVHEVTELERANLAIAYEYADALDDGERDLFAHAIRRDDDQRQLCSPDKASIRAAVALNPEGGYLMPTTREEVRKAFGLAEPPDDEFMGLLERLGEVDAVSDVAPVEGDGYTADELLDELEEAVVEDSVRNRSAES